jgi:chromosome segregation protein
LYLSKIEILGFKSFAQKTVINFNEGITSIVGPNGCGKTNVVDAIRWCLGEQRSGVLRSDKMENVIFNGTANKKPMGMAEVSLTIQNTKGILPTEYNDVTITRRIFRSGESEYLLNKNICRLKDITNLFMDTGIGANAYSVIELKMVETILSNKAEERRVLFEEAAGVNKYKLRRRLALKKLDEVKADLSRVNDIVSEVEKKVNSLERQAKKSNRFTQLSSQLRELELDLAEKEYALFNLKINFEKKSKEENSNQKIQLEFDIKKSEDEISVQRNQLSEIENQLQEKRAEINQIREKIYQSQKFISVQSEKKNSLEQNKIRFANEIIQFENELKNAKAIIEKANLSISELSKTLEEKQLLRIKLEQESEAISVELNQKSSNLKAHSELLIDRIREINTFENQLKNTEQLISDKKAQTEKLDSKIINTTNTIAKTVGYIEELSNERDETKQRIEAAESLYIQKQKEKSLLENQLSELKEKEVELRSVINSLTEKIEFIQNLVDNLEGLSKGAKTLLADKSWSKNKISILADIGNADDKYRFAIEAALNNLLNNLVVDTTEDLLGGIKYLTENKIGKATFFIPSDSASKVNGFLDWLLKFAHKRKAKKISKNPKFIGWTVDFIDSEDRWKAFFKQLLNDICIVQDIETAFDLYGKFRNFSFATLNGDFISKDGFIIAGSEPRLDDTLFGRKKLLENLKKELPIHQEKLTQIQKHISEKENDLNQIDLSVLSERGKMLVNDLAAIEKQISQFEYEIKKSNDEIDKTQREIKDLILESNKLENQKEDFIKSLNNSLKDKDSLEELKKQYESDLTATQQNFNKVISEKNNLDVEIERILGELKNYQNSIQYSEESINSYTLSIQRKQSDIQKSEEEISEIIQQLQSEDKKLNELEEQLNSLSLQSEEIDTKYRDSKLKVNQKEDELKKLRSQRELLQELIHKSDISLKELEIKKESLIEHIKETYSLQISLKEFEDLDKFDFQTRHKEVHELREKIKNLGPVNLLAYSEYEEEKQRLDFLSQQRNDLLESEKDIIKTIEEINQTAQALFKETFDKIRENFIKIFRTLFDPGDEADLRLEENNDPLEAKIEIIAKPRGKRPTSIDLLSGGEKTLTAIALLFAIYLVKPSPFCILDEIDAPLDDANIDRFTRILNEFKKDTQFIVVTHNKRTMESAETLYGVTMQEDGISKLVAVQFNEDFDFAESN